jgi:single-strand DNA-binding protein
MFHPADKNQPTNYRRIAVRRQGRVIVGGQAAKSAVPILSQNGFSNDFLALHRLHHAPVLLYFPAKEHLMAGRSLNRVQLIGNLGKDPEIKYTPSGTPVAKITIATNERFKDKSGEWQDRTEWHNVVLWQRMAEIAGDYLKKGGKVYIEGRLQTRSWEDKQTNQKKYMTEIVASDMILLGGRGESSGESGGGYSRGAAAGGGNNGFDQRTPESEPAAVASGPITDEDIPF